MAAVAVVSHHRRDTEAARRRSSLLQQRNLHPPAQMMANPMVTPTEHDDHEADLFIEMRAAYAAMSHETMEVAARTLQEAWRRKTRKGLPIARCQVKSLGATIDERSMGMASMLRYLVWVTLFIVMVTMMRNPPDEWGFDLDGEAGSGEGKKPKAKHEYTPAFRADYAQQRAIIDMLANAEWDGPGTYHADVRSRDDWYDWLKALIGTLYDDDTYNSRNFKDYVKTQTADGVGGMNSQSKAYIGDYNKVFSALMITQQRRTLKLCDDKIAEDQQENYHTLVPVCYTSAETKYADFFPSDVLYNETFLPLSNAMKSKPLRAMMRDAFSSATADEMGGYFIPVDLGNMNGGKGQGGVALSLEIVDVLQSLKWLDRQTKSIAIELVTVNPNVMLINRCVILFAFDLGGHVTPTVRVTSVPFYAAYDLRIENNRWRIIIEILFFSFTVALVIAEIKELVTGGVWSYLKDLSNIIDLVGLGSAMGLAVVWFACQHLNSTFKMPVMDFTKGLDMALKRKIIASQNTLSKMANGAQVFDFFIFWFALVAVFGMIKAFMFHPKLGVVGHTLMRASKDLGTFFLIFFLVNVVYTWATSSLFGRRVEAFSTLPLAFFSLFRWFMGDFGSFDSIQEEFMPLDLGVGPQLMALITWFSFVMVNTILLQNVVLSIVVDAFMDQKEAAATTSELQDDCVMCCFATHCGVDFIAGDCRRGGCLECCCALCRRQKKTTSINKKSEESSSSRKRRDRHHFKRIKRESISPGQAKTEQVHRLEEAETYMKGKECSREAWMRSTLLKKKAARKPWAQDNSIDGNANPLAKTIRLPRLATLRSAGPQPETQREIFDRYDVDKSGELCMMMELPPALKDMGLNPAGDFSQYDANHTGTISFSEYMKLVAHMVGETHIHKELDATRVKMVATDAAYTIDQAALNKETPNAVVTAWRRVRSWVRSYCGRRVDLFAYLVCDVFSSSSIDGALTDIETLMLSLNVDTLSLGQIDSALKRRGVEEWPRMLIFERLYELANAAEKERYLYGERVDGQEAREKAVAGHATIETIAAMLHTQAERLERIESALGASKSGESAPHSTAKKHEPKPPSSRDAAVAFARKHKVRLPTQLGGVHVNVNGVLPVSGRLTTFMEEAPPSATVPPSGSAKQASPSPAPSPSSSAPSPSKWQAHTDGKSGRTYYANAADGSVRWEPPPDLVPCPFDGGFWDYVKTEGGAVSTAPISLSELWKLAAEGTLNDEASVGLHGDNQYWPMKSILRRAMTVSHLFASADEDHNGSLTTDEFTSWLKREGGSTIDPGVIDLLHVFQSIDADEDGAVTELEFMCFLLQHAQDVQSLVTWIDSKW